jgi:hypothetical protein
MGTNEVSEACSMQNNSFNAIGDRMFVYYGVDTGSLWILGRATQQAVAPDGSIACLSNTSVKSPLV